MQHLKERMIKKFTEKENMTDKKESQIELKKILYKIYFT